MPKNLRSTFLNLQPTIGQESYVPLDQLEFRELNYESTYGVKDLTAASILDLAKKLSEDEDLHQDYLVRKLGYDPSIPAEVERSFEILSGMEIVIETDVDTYSMWPQLCLMTSNISVEEYAECLTLDPSQQLVLPQ